MFGPTIAFRGLTIVALLVACQSFASQCSAATTIDLSTDNEASWLVTAAGAVGVSAFDTSINRAGDISLTDNGLVSGNFVLGASAANYNGFWYVENSFILPSNATNVQFAFENLWGNDRVVMTLNGVDIGNATFGGGTGLGLMKFVESDPDQPYVFNETTSGNISTGFVLGGTNVVRLTVNNTGVNLAAPTVPAAFPLDGTVVHLPTALVTFDAAAVPEPTMFGTAVVLLACGSFRRKRRESTL